MGVFRRSGKNDDGKCAQVLSQGGDATRTDVTTRCATQHGRTEQPIALSMQAACWSSGRAARLVGRGVVCEGAVVWAAGLGGLRVRFGERSGAHQNQRVRASAWLPTIVNKSPVAALCLTESLSIDLRRIAPSFVLKALIATCPSKRGSSVSTRHGRGSRPTPHQRCPPRKVAEHSTRKVGHVSGGFILFRICYLDTWLFGQQLRICHTLSGALHREIREYLPVRKNFACNNSSPPCLRIQTYFLALADSSKQPFHLRSTVELA